MSTEPSIPETHAEVEPIEAQWSVSLDAECPQCEQYVNLLDYADFWDGRKLEIGEHDTKRSDAVEVVCPQCGFWFTVKCTY